MKREPKLNILNKVYQTAIKNKMPTRKSDCEEIKTQQQMLEKVKMRDKIRGYERSLMILQ